MVPPPLHQPSCHGGDGTNQDYGLAVQSVLARWESEPTGFHWGQVVFTLHTSLPTLPTPSPCSLSRVLYQAPSPCSPSVLRLITPSLCSSSLVPSLLRHLSPPPCSSPNSYSCSLSLLHLPTPPTPYLCSFFLLLLPSSPPCSFFPLLSLPLLACLLLFPAPSPCTSLLPSSILLPLPFPSTLPAPA